MTFNPIKIILTFLYSTEKKSEISILSCLSQSRFKEIMSKRWNRWYKLKYGNSFCKDVENSQLNWIKNVQLLTLCNSMRSLVVVCSVLARLNSFWRFVFTLWTACYIICWAFSVNRPLKWSTAYWSISSNVKYLIWIFGFC